MAPRAKRVTGRYEISSAGGEQVAAFIPYALPPSDPPLILPSDRLRLAEQALVRLELAGEMVPSLSWFIYAFVRKEAVLSSQIEGTQATLVDLLAFEAEGPGEELANHPDLEEVCNYLDALNFARAHMADPAGLPLSMRLLNQTHERLMRGVRGAHKLPGEVRRSQNWLGGSRPGNASYVPPPPQALPELLSAFEKYIHLEPDDADSLPALVRAGLLHVQFETIHPYLDGNGRIGRMLVMLLLEQTKLLTRPLLYLSLYFKRNRDEYYRRLNAVRVEGDWEAWLDFFLEGVTRIADEAVTSARELFLIIATDRERLLQHPDASVPALRLFELLPRSPIITIASVIKQLGTSKPTAGRAITALCEIGVLTEMTGKKRDRSWVYQSYLDRLRVGTELDLHYGRESTAGAGGV